MGSNAAHEWAGGTRGRERWRVLPLTHTLTLRVLPHVLHQQAAGGLRLRGAATRRTRGREARAGVSV